MQAGVLSRSHPALGVIRRIRLRDWLLQVLPEGRLFFLGLLILWGRQVVPVATTQSQSQAARKTAPPTKFTNAARNRRRAPSLPSRVMHASLRTTSSAGPGWAGRTLSAVSLRRLAGAHEMWSQRRANYGRQ